MNWPLRLLLVIAFTCPVFAGDYCSIEKPEVLTNPPATIKGVEVFNMCTRYLGEEKQENTVWRKAEKGDCKQIDPLRYKDDVQYKSWVNLSYRSVCVVKYLSEEERKPYLAEVKGGKIFHGNEAVSCQDCIFVVATDKRLYVAPGKDPGQFNHSSLTAGAPVLMAGHMQIENGRLIAMNNLSGHYRPDELSLASLKKSLGFESGVRKLNPNQKVEYISSLEDTEVAPPPTTVQKGKLKIVPKTNK